jgi:cytochrome c6
MNMKTGSGFTRLTSLSIFLLLALGSNASYAADPGKGATIYSTQCASCHGATGISIMPGAPSFAHGQSLMQPDTTLAASIRNGKNSMPAFRGILSDTDILNVIAYLRTFN